jgi:hypothetical protein
MRKIIFDIEDFQTTSPQTTLCAINDFQQQNDTMVSKKRKASGQGANGKRDFDKSNSKLAITTYEDVADSEDEFHINRDKVLLDEEPHAAKRQRKSRDEGWFQKICGQGHF